MVGKPAVYKLCEDAIDQPDRVITGLKLNIMIDTNWDIDAYKTEHESDEHWELRKKFILAHKDRLEEDDLICMAQVFTNIEFLGCRYPDETMKKVAELAKGVVEEFREKKKNCLKRTFVAASDAASSKVKGNHRSQKPPDKEDPISFHKSANLTNQQNPPAPLLNLDLESEPKRFKSTSDKAWPINLPQGSGPHKNIVVVMLSGMSCAHHLEQTLTKNKIPFRYDYTTLESGGFECEIVLNEKVAFTAAATNKLSARTLAISSFLDILRKQCYTILIKPHEGELIERDGLISATHDEGVSDANVGSKMMRLMGWQGGGLGSKSQGIVEPIKANQTSHRRGLGTNAKGKDTNFKQLALSFLKSWIDRAHAPDLLFSASFAKEERAVLHGVAQSLGLKSKSHGRGDDRQLTVSKKFELWPILFELSRCGGVLSNYVLLRPGEADPEWFIKPAE